MSAWRVLTVSCGGPVATPLCEAHRPLLLVCPADATGEALAGAVAAANGAAIVGRISSVERLGADLLVSRSTHGGRLSTQLRLKGGLAVATAHDPGQVDGKVVIGAPSNLAIDCTPLSEDTVSLEVADIVVSGGRGLDAAGFAALERIAHALGGAVAASLPAVDLGLAPVARQVGQSGKFVNPAIYLAAGMSGTLQHFAGVGPRARIVAVNSDRSAPVFGIASLGVVADAAVLLPRLADALEGKATEGRHAEAAA